tara:strand:+ start:850 stop:1419 length:570 start_codon:yes stop_codon:yes gene_type:complete
MVEKVEFDLLEETLHQCGAYCGAAQSHGLLTGHLVVGGAPIGAKWLLQVLENTDEEKMSREECIKQLDILYQSTFWQLSERLSEFMLLLPDDSEDIANRVDALAQWTEGFLHGLVTAKDDKRLKKRLSSEPLSEIIKDILQITQVRIEDEIDEEDSDVDYSELVEYIRIAVQLCYEELSDIRNAKRKST